MRGTPREQDDRLEQARLPRRVGTRDELRPGTELDVQRGVPAKIGEPERLELRGGGGRRDQDVVRTGISTCT
jgi:hypothetical protein